MSGFSGGLISAPPTGFTKLSNVFQKDVTFTPGAIAALTGTLASTSVPGLLTTDQVMVQCVSAPPAGMQIANARVVSTDNLEIFFVTSVAIGITLGSLTFRVTVLR